MAAEASRRVSDAVARGGGSVSSRPQGGFLGQRDQSRDGRRKRMPASTEASMAARLQAGQQRDRRAPQPAGDAGRLRGAAPRPLAPTMSVGSRLAAGQAADRHAASQRTNTTPSDGGALADFERGRGKRAFLELPTRSYTQPEPTSEERELERQQKMQETMEQFLVTGEGGEPEEIIEPDEGVGAPRPRREAQEPEEAGAPEREVREEVREETRRIGEVARIQAEAAQQAAQQEAAAADAATQSAEITRLRRVRMIWRVVEGTELATSPAGVPLLFYILQVSLQIINKYTFKARIIPEPTFPEEVGGCCSCFGCFLLLLLIVALFVAFVSILQGGFSNLLSL